jgi:hypothetical protein
VPAGAGGRERGDSGVPDAERADRDLSDAEQPEVQGAARERDLRDHNQDGAGDVANPSPSSNFWQAVSVAMTVDADGSAHRGRTLVVALLCWLALVTSNYLTYPMLAALFVFGLLLLVGCWLWTVVGSVALVVALFRRGAHAGAVGCLLVMVLAGVGVWTTDWPRIYVDSQFRLHRGDLAALAAEHRAGRLPPDARLPWRLRYLSIDGQAHRRDGALYLPVWEDWRAEQGGGFGYFPTPPGPNTIITTAAGDTGRPLRQLGDGWWWLE